MPVQNFEATSSRATAVAIQSANAIVFRATRTEVLSISQLYFASILISFVSGVRPGLVLSLPVLHLQTYTDERGKGSAQFLRASLSVAI